MEGTEDKPKICPMKVWEVRRGLYHCVGEECAWYDNGKCAVVGIVEQLWYLRKDASQ